MKNLCYFKITWTFRIETFLSTQHQALCKVLPILYNMYTLALEMSINNHFMDEKTDAQRPQRQGAQNQQAE